MMQLVLRKALEIAVALGGGILVGCGAIRVFLLLFTRDLPPEVEFDIFLVIKLAIIGIPVACFVSSFTTGILLPRLGFSRGVARFLAGVVGSVLLAGVIAAIGLDEELILCVGYLGAIVTGLLLGYGVRRGVLPYLLGRAGGTKADPESRGE